MTATQHASDGAGILTALHDALTRYVVLPSPEAVVAVALWIAATHAQPAWQHAPRLVIRAPEKRCGKSRLLDIVEATCHRPLITVNASPAAVYRSIGTDHPPTLLVDEADTIFGGGKADASDELRGLLNAGHQRNRPALRWDANAHAVDVIPTFAMAALAGIGAMPDTIEDRAVVIRMRRRAPGEHVSPYRYRRDRPDLTTLAASLTDWLAPRLADLETAEPPMPLEDRAADTWEPLITIADLAAGDWPALARTAAVTLTASHQATATQSDRIRLLTDCRAALADTDALPSHVLIERLKSDPESPWTDPPPGLTAAKMGALLADYDITSSIIRFGPPWGRVRGYHRADFTDAWTRYTTPPCDQPQRADGAPDSECHGSSRDTRQAVTPLTCNVTPVTAGTAHPRLAVISEGGAA